MSNDNKNPVSAEVKPVTKQNFREHPGFKHIEAFIALRQAAATLLNELHPDDYSPEEKAIAAALADSHLTPGNELLLLALMEQLLTFVLPGDDIIADGLGLSSMKSADGDFAIGLILTIQPGKNVLRIMPRKTAEAFEKGLKKLMDETFGRLIRL